MAKADYDEEYDILYICKADERAKFSIEMFDNFVIDIGPEGKVVGLEVMEASKVFKMPKSEFKKIKEARISTFMQNELFGVMYYVKFAEKEIESEMLVPVAAAIKR